MSKHSLLLGQRSGHVAGPGDDLAPTRPARTPSGQRDTQRRTESLSSRDPVKAGADSSPPAAHAVLQVLLNELGDAALHPLPPPHCTALPRATCPWGRVTLIWDPVERRVVAEGFRRHQHVARHGGTGLFPVLCARAARTHADKHPVTRAHCDAPTLHCQRQRVASCLKYVKARHELTLSKLSAQDMGYYGFARPFRSTATR